VTTEAGLADAHSLNPIVSIVGEDGSVTDLTSRSRRFVNDALLVSGKALDGLSSLTTTFWFKTDKDQTQVIFNSAGGPSALNAFEVGLNNAFYINIIEKSQNSLFVRPNGIGNLADNVFHHYAIVRDAVSQSYRVYVDGLEAPPYFANTPVVLGRLSVANDGLIVGQRPNSIGGNFAPGFELIGQLDELTIWNRALSVSELDQIRAGKINAASPSLRLWLPMNEPSGDVVKDRSAAGYNGKFLKSYSATLLAGSPILYYPLNEFFGTQAIDATGSGRNGTYSGTINLYQPSATTNLGTSVNFTAGSVNVPAIGGVPQVTVEAWVRPTAYPTGGNRHRYVYLHHCRLGWGHCNGHRNHHRTWKERSSDQSYSQCRLRYLVKRRWFLECGRCG
jgi:hypothetical protein